MAMHMVNNMWLAKVELHGLQPMDSTIQKIKHSGVDTHNDAREKILTSLIEKSEKLNKESQIQEKQATSKQPPKKSTKPAKKPKTPNKKKVDTWAEDVEQDKKRKLAALAKKSELKNLSKKKAASVLSKVKTKLPLIKKGKKSPNKLADNQPDSSNNTFNEELLDDPNRSSIMVSPGFIENIDDSIIKAREEVFKDPNSSGVKVHKILKKRTHEKQEPGSNTIIMKLSSSSGKKSGAKLSIPEQCQEAINLLTEQFPGYDMVAIRNMAAEKVGVSPQYIENLNILPEKAG